MLSNNNFQTRFLLAGFFLLLFTTLNAQDLPKLEKNRSIGLVPQYAILSGIRLDLDYRLKKAKPQWLIVSPQVYLSPDNPNLWSYDHMWGLGMELQHRYYLGKNALLPKGVYLGYGPMFQYFSIEDTRLYAQEIIENGTTYTVVKNGPITTGVYKFGMTATAGVQAIIQDIVYVDFYTGAGIRFSFDDQSSGLHRIYNDWWGDYGYSGTLMTFGIRLGLLIPKR